MITVKAQGQARHCFFGDYFARIALVFESAEDARNALAVLGRPWQISEIQPRALVAQLTGDEKDAFGEKYKPTTAPCERRECKKRRKVGPRHDWDGINHSIDYSPPFEVTIEIPAFVSDAQLPLPQVSP